MARATPINVRLKSLMSDKPKVEKLADYLIDCVSGVDVLGSNAVYNKSLKQLFMYTNRIVSPDALKMFEIWIDVEEKKYKEAYKEEADLYEWIDTDLPDESYATSKGKEARQRWYLHTFNALGGIKGFLWSLERE